MHRPPPIESSARLRSLVRSKRKCGRDAEAILLARLGAHIATRERVAERRDEVSRIALARYLQAMPDDLEARQALSQLEREIAVPPAHPGRRRRLLWMVFAACGLSTAGAILVGGLPSASDAATVTAPPAAAGLSPAALLPVAATAKAEPAAAAPTPIVIHAVGDVVLGSDFPVYRLPGRHDKKRIAALLDELGNADIVVGNLEGVLSDRGEPRKDTSRPGLFAFRMPEAYAATLREMGFDVLSLANNHAMDFGSAGLEATIRALKSAGIQPVGAPGAEMAVIKVKNTSVAFLNYSYLSSFARLDDEQRVSTEIRHARAQADLVVVTVHGGKEGSRAAGAPRGDEYFMDEYRGDMQKFSHLAIDCGASAVFGHGPHVVRPYEIYRGKPIFFSLGNFVGYRSLSTKGKLANSIVAEVRLTPRGEFLGAGVIPLKLDRSGIPQADYSVGNLSALDGLLDERLAKRPVLELAAGRR
jgi:hypothetical protein